MPPGLGGRGEKFFAPTAQSIGPPKGEGVRVGVGEYVSVWVGVCDARGGAVEVKVAVCVGVGVGLGVSVDVWVSVGVFVGLGVGV